MVDYWKDPFTRCTGACIRNKDKSKACLPSDHWNCDYAWAFYGSIKCNNITIIAQPCGSLILLKKKGLKTIKNA